MVDIKVWKKMLGVTRGRVILKNCWVRLAPSMVDAS